VSERDVRSDFDGSDMYRIGHGYDLHRLEPRSGPLAGSVKPLIVAGVTLEWESGLIAHSDGDVLYHAVVDAMMGALAMPDIGQMFPDKAAENAGRDSADFVREAVLRVRGAGWAVVNLDCTVILERPRIGPVKDQMRANIARLLACDVGDVNVKGKSHEKVDAVGEGRAIEAHVVVLLKRVWRWECWCPGAFVLWSILGDQWDKDTEVGGPTSAARRSSGHAGLASYNRGMSETIFSKIIRGEIPCHKVYEDAHVLAFLDIGPLSIGHTLVIPKEAKATLGELSDDSAAAIGRVLPRLCRAVMKATGATAYNVLQNNGVAAHQAVMHVHFHIIPKFDDSAKGPGLGIQWKSQGFDHGAGAALAKQIASYVG
jgi:2-C-methyl-D-erythritol 2,4-cyclodiphosphate synthase